MIVEECCQALLAEILPQLHDTSPGYAIEIGCGTFAFYCQLFDKLGLSSIAIEPLPARNLRKLCKYRNIRLIEACVAEHNGWVDLYIGNYKNEENLNLNSIRSDWWGVNSKIKKVKSITLKSIVSECNIKKIICLKIDIEGAEYSVLRQLSDLNRNLIPKVLMFEYGGGGTFENNQGGWSEVFFYDTLNILTLLQKLGYKQIIKIDAEEESCENILDLETFSGSFNNIFSPKNNYGNIIAIHMTKYPKSLIEKICMEYRDKQSKAAPLKINESLIKRLSINIRQLIYR